MAPGPKGPGGKKLDLFFCAAYHVCPPPHVGPFEGGGVQGTEGGGAYEGEQRSHTHRPFGTTPTGDIYAEAYSYSFASWAVWRNQASYLCFSTSCKTPDQVEFELGVGGVEGELWG